MAKRTRGAKKEMEKEQEQKSEDHPNLLWPGVDKIRKGFHNDILWEISIREIHVPRIVDWKVMEKLGCHEILDDMILARLVYKG